MTQNQRMIEQNIKTDFEPQILKALSKGPLRAIEIKPCKKHSRDQPAWCNALARLGQQGFITYNNYTKQHRLTKSGWERLEQPPENATPKKPKKGERLIDAKMASVTLGVTTSMIHHMAREGSLTRYKEPGQRTFFFSLKEVIRMKLFRS